MEANYLQIRMGCARKPTKRGHNVTGETAAVEAEMRDVLARARDKEGVKYRGSVQKLSHAMRDEKAGSVLQVNKEFAAIYIG